MTDTANKIVIKVQDVSVAKPSATPSSPPPGCEIGWFRTLIPKTVYTVLSEVGGHLAATSAGSS